MSDELGEHRARLAQAFDLGFTRPFSSERPELRDFLVLRLGTFQYALPVDEIAGVQLRKTIQYLPDAPAHCLGLAGVRGRVGAVYDLAGLLGSATSDRLTWFLQTRLDPEIALLAPKPDRYLRVPLDRIVLCAETDGATVGALTDEEVGINVLSVDRLVEAIRRRGGGRVP
jgi:chemotaxis signal transduction protein